MSLQSRYVVCKALCNLVSPKRFADWVVHEWPDANVVTAIHDEPGKVKHFHAVIRFPGVRHWDKLRSWLQSPENDPHSHSDAARSWRRSVRYLLHLDNREKAPIPWENLDSRNIDDSELAQLLGTPKAQLVDDLICCASMSPAEMVGYLTSRGYGMHEITSTVNAFLSCARFADFARHYDVGMVAQASSNTTFEEFGGGIPDGLPLEFAAGLDDVIFP